MELEPLFFSHESKQLDQYAIETYKFNETYFMGLAAVAILTSYRELFFEKKTIILAGSGNNGGDGLALAWLLTNADYDVQVFIQNTGKHSQAYDHYLNLIQKVLPISSLEKFILGPIAPNTVIVDCLLGTGFKPPLREPYLSLVAYLNTRQDKKRSTILSIDTPSGFYPGAKINDFVKPAMLAEIGMHKLENSFLPFSLDTTLLPIGFPVHTFNKKQSEHSFRLRPVSIAKLQKASRRKPNSNKYANGAMAVVGGSAGMSGAVITAQNAFHAAGGGISKIYSPTSSTIKAVLKKDPSMMVSDFTFLPEDSFIKKVNALIVGPGLKSTDLKSEQLHALIGTIPQNTAVIIDAGGIDISIKTNFTVPILYTPHTGEFFRLIGQKQEDPLARMNALKEYCTQHKVHILLKDYLSVLGDPDGNIYVFSEPNEKMAVMGSGDMLTGFIALFICRGYSIPEAVHYAMSLSWYSKNIPLKNPTVHAILKYIGTIL